MNRLHVVYLNNDSIEHDFQPNTNIIIEVGHTSDNTSSDDPIELFQQFENNNVTTNDHNNNNSVRTSYTYSNWIEDLPHQNNNEDQIVNEDDLFHDQCDNCKRRQYQNAHILYKLDIFSTNSSNIRLPVDTKSRWSFLLNDLKRKYIYQHP